MKKNKLVGCGALVFVSMYALQTAMLYAQTDLPDLSPSTSSSTPLQNEEIRAVPERAPAIREALSSAKQTRAINLSANISNRFDAIANRLQAITIRLQSRIDKMEAEGFEVAVAQAKLVEAQKEITSIKATMTTIDVKVSETTQSERPQETWLGTRLTFIQIHQQLVLVRQLMLETVSLLKESVLQGTLEIQNTSTVSTTTDVISN